MNKAVQKVITEEKKKKRRMGGQNAGVKLYMDFSGTRMTLDDLSLPQKNGKIQD